MFFQKMHKMCWMPIQMGVPLMPHLQAKPIIKYGNCAKRVSATRKTAPGA
jgi:hypothetical protein